MTSSVQSGPSASNAPELLAAISSGSPHVAIRGRISGLPPITLSPGQTIEGADENAMLVFDDDGLALTRDNRVRMIDLVSPSECRALYLGAQTGDRGSFELYDVTCNGQISFIFDDETSAAAVTLDMVAIAGADTRAHVERPSDNGVEILQGALTVWNRSTRPSTITLSARQVDIGFTDIPIKGTGLFIAGAGRGQVGQVIAQDVEVNAVHIDTGLPGEHVAAAAGGVFILSGASVERLICKGSIITHGANAIAMENCGRVGDWILVGNAICHGSSAIGFLNAGHLGQMEVFGAIETFGDGGTGCAVYGPVSLLKAGAIRTHGDAAVAVQITDLLDRLEVRDGIFTRGEPSYAMSEQGMQEKPAHAIHIDRSGALRMLIADSVCTSGSNALPFFNEGRFG